MRGVQAPCPACGAPVRFRVSSSLVTVCEHCHSVVARADRKLEDLGKVAAIVDTDSPLQLGLRGTFRNKAFEIVGRVQYAHAAGGMWDEWYAAFANGKWGWLAEAQGRFYLTFEHKLSEDETLPPFDDLVVGESIDFGSVGTYSVAEVGEARTKAAEGEIPYAVVPNSRHPFADLYGKDGAFATLDYSGDEPKIYVGKTVPLSALGIPESVVAPDDKVRQISAVQVNCPNCAGQLTLHAPDETQRVTCPNCRAVLDAEQGKLQFLKTLSGPKIKPQIPIGATGNLFDAEYTVIGMLRRSVTEEGENYYWNEYLLYNPREGFRWLIANDGHWSFARPVSPGEVEVSEMSAEFEGRTFKIFQRGIASVRYVLGEFYWKVQLGERAFTTDFIAPPDMLSVERSALDEDSSEVAAKAVRGRRNVSGEVNISIGTYVPRETVEKAFGIPALPSSWKVAPNQPYPVDRRIYFWWVVFAVALILMDVIFSNGLIKQGVDQFFFVLSLGIMSLIPVCALIYRYFFEKSRWSDSPFSPYPSFETDE